MPSPFPGMDPFLEDPEIFPDLHIGLIFCLQGQLQELLPPPYFAACGRRVWVEASRRHVEPDVDVLQPADKRKGSTQSDSEVAVLEATGAKPIILSVPREEYWEPYLDILGKRKGKETVVTSIEVVSPSNKAHRSPGRKKYKKKQREMARGKVNLVEIDLLRGGKHATAIPLDRALKEAGTFEFHVSIRPRNGEPTFHFYPVRVYDALPKLAIPLLHGDPFVAVNLQSAFARAYDNGPYARQINYAKDQPVPPLRPDQAEWAAAILRDKGLLPPAS